MNQPLGRFSSRHIFGVPLLNQQGIAPPDLSHRLVSPQLPIIPLHNQRALALFEDPWPVCPLKLPPIPFHFLHITLTTSTPPPPTLDLTLPRSSSLPRRALFQLKSFARYALGFCCWPFALSGAGGFRT